MGFRNQLQILKRMSGLLNNVHVFHVFLNFSRESQNEDFRHFELSRWEVQNRRKWPKIATLREMHKTSVFCENKIDISKTDRDIQVENIDFFSF